MTNPTRMSLSIPIRRITTVHETMVLEPESLRRKDINNHHDWEKTFQGIREAINFTGNSRRALRRCPQRERNGAQDTNAA